MIATAEPEVGTVIEDGVQCRLMFQANVPDSEFYQDEFGDLGGPAVSADATTLQDGLAWRTRQGLSRRETVARVDDDEVARARVELAEALRILERGRGGASAEWLAAAESYVELVQQRYVRITRRSGAPSSAVAPADATRALPPKAECGR